MRGIVLALMVSILPLAAPAQGLPEYREIYVNDFAALLSDSQQDAIRDRLRALRAGDGIEFTVVTISRMSDYGHSGAIEPFATALFNEWGVGDASRNDGVMMLVARHDRKIRLEVGSGYGASLDAPMQRIIDDVILPEFRQDRYAEGIARGTDAVIFELTGTAPEGMSAWRYRLDSWLAWIAETIEAFLLPVAAFAVGLPVWLYRRWLRNRQRICPAHGRAMTRLDEEWDDHHLQQGQVKEEELKSVDYDVWECPKCQHRQIEAYKALFSRYGACRACGYRTVEGETEILEEATTSSTGTKRIDYTCLHCGDRYSVTKTIPRKSKSSSSGGSSFGGGSSSGGGASGSW